jgi:copper chaperone CopZ
MKKATLFLMITLSLFFVAAQAQQKTANSKYKKTDVLKIKTSARCGMCKERIEKNLVFEKGVKSAELNLEDKILTVSYRPDKTDPDKIRKAVSRIGYDADHVLADPEAYEKLPPCCKKGGHEDQEAKAR